jgi:hypothetical protein
MLNTKPLRGHLRIADHATLVPSQQAAAWVEQASAMPLSKIELAVVDAIYEHHRRACACHAAKLSIESLAFDVGGVAPRRVSAAVARLVDPGLLAVRRGSGQKGSQYLPCLPKRTLAVAALAAAQEPAVPF